PFELGRCGVPSELDREATGPGVPLLGLQLAGDESDRHDPELLGCVEQPAARLLPFGIRLEDNLAEPGERILDCCLVVDRQPAAPARVDIREGSVGKARALFRAEARHAATIARFPRPREHLRAPGELPATLRTARVHQRAQLSASIRPLASATSRLCSSASVPRRPATVLCCATRSARPASA